MKYHEYCISIQIFVVVEFRELKKIVFGTRIRFSMSIVTHFAIAAKNVRDSILRTVHSPANKLRRMFPFLPLHNLLHLLLLFRVFFFLFLSSVSFSPHTHQMIFRMVCVLQLADYLLKLYAKKFLPAIKKGMLSGAFQHNQN